MENRRLKAVRVVFLEVFITGFKGCMVHKLSYRWSLRVRLSYRWSLRVRLVPIGGATPQDDGVKILRYLVLCTKTNAQFGTGQTEISE